MASPYSHTLADVILVIINPMLLFAKLYCYRRVSIFKRGY